MDSIGDRRTKHAYSAELGPGSNHPASYSVGSGASSGRDRTDQIDAGHRRKRIDSECSFSGHDHAVVVGAEIGGLAASLVLSRVASRVTLVERAERPSCGRRDFSLLSGRVALQAEPLSKYGCRRISIGAMARGAWQ